MSRGLKGKLNPGWKGDNVSYSGLHKWLNREKGSPKICEECGLNNENRRYEWSNISGIYNRNLDNYRRLCVSCHRKEAFKKGAIPWNKGTKGTCKPNKTSFKKGHKLNRGKYRVKNPGYHTLYMRKYRTKIEIRET